MTTAQKKRGAEQHPPLIGMFWLLGSFALAPSHSLDKDWISPTMDGCPDWAAEGWQEVRGLYRGEDEVAAHEAAERLVEDQRLRLGNALPSRFRVEAELLWGKLNPPSLLPWIAGAALSQSQLISSLQCSRSRATLSTSQN